MKKVPEKPWKIKPFFYSPRFKNSTIILIIILCALTLNFDTFYEKPFKPMSTLVMTKYKGKLLV